MSETSSKERRSFLLSLTIFLQLNTKHNSSPFLLLLIHFQLGALVVTMVWFPSLGRAGLGFVLSCSSSPSAPLI